jgi:UDP:flavonoid glycosyltransferase YjiC (YdhE family)
MNRFLIMTWDGAGNLAPTLGIARTLVGRGHDVRLMGHRTIAERCGDVGTRFVPLSHNELWDALEDPTDFEAEIRLLINEVSFSSTVAGDLAAELHREPADVVLVDCMLFTAIDVALASGTPTATLFHTAYTIFRGGPLVEMPGRRPVGPRARPHHHHRDLYTAPAPDEVIAHVLAHHERQRTQRAKPPAPPAPGYRPEVLATLFGAPTADGGTR